MYERESEKEHAGRGTRVSGWEVLVGRKGGREGKTEGEGWRNWERDLRSIGRNDFPSIPGARSRFASEIIVGVRSTLLARNSNLRRTGGGERERRAERGSGRRKGQQGRRGRQRGRREGREGECVTVRQREREGKRKGARARGS